MPRSKMLKKKASREKIEKICLEILTEVAKESGEGSLIVVGNTKRYKEHFPNFFRKNKISVFDEGMKTVLIKLAQIDGAIIIGEDGVIRAYGARITVPKTLLGKGTRHSAAVGISMQRNVTALLLSEEEKVIKVFKKGVKLIEINPFTKNINKGFTKVVKIINSPEAIVVAGASIASPLLGVSVLPGVVIFGGSYYLIKNLIRIIKGK